MSEISTHKVCSKCKRELPRDQFTKDQSKKDGKRPSCKQCESAGRRAAHDDAKRATQRAYRAANRDRVRAWHRSWRAANRETLLVGKRASYQRHKDTTKARQRQYYQRNAEHYREYQRLHARTIAGFTTQVWNSLNCRTINGSSPAWQHPRISKAYLAKGVRLALTKEELRAIIRRDWDAIQAIWGSGRKASIDRIGPSIHYSAGNIQFISVNENSRKACQTKAANAAGKRNANKAGTS